jgi:hypothetical protein
MVRFYFIILVITSFATLNLYGGSAHAQPVLQAEQASPPVVSAPPKSLGEMLPNAYWNVEEWGVLLAVAPERTLPKQKPNIPQVPLPTPPPRGYNLTNILTLFECQTMRSGTVAAVAPVFMRVFTRPTISAEDASLIGKEEAATELFASFTPAQWQTAGSANGIGRGDLAPKQQKLYDGILPENAVLHPVYRAPKPGEPPLTPQTPITLTPQQIVQMRLRLSTTIQMYYTLEGGNNNSFYGFGMGEEDNQQKINYYLSTMPPDPEESQDPLIRKMYPKVPNKLKSSDIDYKSARLNAEIPLKGIVTIEDLMNRISQATQLTLYVDARAEKRLLYLRGETARAGDLLQALCLATLGTFRKMGNNIFLFTENKDGLGTRLVAYRDWQQEIFQIRDKRNTERYKTMRKNGIQLPLDNFFGLSDDIKQIVGKKWGVSSAQKGVDTTKLPEKLQQLIKKQSERLVNTSENGGSTTEHRVRTDQVFLASQPRATFLLTGFGEFQANLNTLYNLPYGDEEPPAPEPTMPPKPPAFVLPEAWKKRSLMATVKDIEEAKKVIQWAHEGGFNKVWLAVLPLAGKAKPILQEAIKAAKPHNIAVGVVFNHLRIPKNNEIMPYIADINIYGETSDVFAERVKDNPQFFFFGQNFNQIILAPMINNKTYLQKEMAQIATTPQLTGILFDLNTLGGYQSEPYWGYGNPMGYYAANRMNFLQKWHVDPIDIPANFYEQPPVMIPYFHTNQGEYIMLPNGSYGPNPEHKDWNKTWSDFIAVQTREMKNLDQEYYNILSQSKIPLYVQLKDTDLVASWQKADMTFKQPQYKEGDDYSLAQLKAAQKLSPILFRRILPWPSDLKQWEDSLSYYTQVADKNSILQGVLFDFSSIPTDKLPAYLQVLEKKIASAKK